MRLLICLLLAAVLAAGAVHSSPVPASIVAGVVVDASGQVVAYARVTLQDGRRVIETTTTNARGAFQFENVPEGIYQVHVDVSARGTVSIGVAVTDLPVPPLRLVLAPPTPVSDSATAAAETRMEPTRRAQIAASMPVAQMLGGLGGHYAMAPGAAPEWNREAYSRIDENGFHRVADDPLSTFSIDVDTASYANVRRFIEKGTLPPADAVRVEELLNYFRFDYGWPADDRPFTITTEVGPAPWAPSHNLVLVGLKSRPLDLERTPPRNLVFLLDVSGSMASADKLPLVKTAMRMLAATLRQEDRVAIVVYAGASGVALPSTSGADKTRIEQAIATLDAGGSTNGAAGIRLAYDIAAQSFVAGGINRVILATDGDFNVGVTSQGELTRLIEDQRKRGVFLSVLGVGTGNLNDATMEQLANRGNGNYSYLDSLHEARRVLVAEAGGTLVTVAKDVKIQVEFNPARVGAYRLIGYENRLLANRDFNDDTKDAGEMGAGHTVTALYEIVPPGVDVNVADIDPLRYQATTQPTTAAGSDELLTVKVRYKQPDGDESRLVSDIVRVRNHGELSPNLGFASAVAEFGMLLRRSDHAGQASWAQARDLARRYRGDDTDGYRAEFVRLVDLAAALDAQQARSPQSHR